MLLFDKRVHRFTRGWMLVSIFLGLLNAFYAVAFHDVLSLILVVAMGLVFLDSHHEAKKELAALPVEDHRE